MDIRQALYLKDQSDDSIEVLLRLRDYSSKGGGRPDPQHLLLLDLDAGTSSERELGEDLALVELHVSPARTLWVAGALNLGDGASPTTAPLQLVCSRTDFSREDLMPGQRLLPLGFLDEQTVEVRPVRSVQLDNGLVAPAIDWKLPAQRYDLSTRQLEEDPDGLLVPDAGGRQLAGYQVDYTPVLPADAKVIYYAAGADSKTARRLAQFSYHVSYSAFEWLPPLIWLSDTALATVQFLPDTSGVSLKPNHVGLFRLVTLGTRDGHVTLIEDHLPADLPIAADNGVLFYTLQECEGDDVRWGLWAASGDGLVKQRLWEPDAETVYLSVEDAAGGRLLVNRQYFTGDGQRPQLVSELREFSLEPLTGGTVEIQLATPGPLPPVHSATENPDSGQTPTTGGSGISGLPVPR